MNIKDFKAALPYLFKTEITPFIWGHAGVGKSSIIKQYAQEVGYKFFPFYLGTQSDLGDVLGLAEFITMADGSKATDFATPKWLKDTVVYCKENPDSGAIIFLDEFNRARRDILNGMFSLALDKTFHTLKLPKNCHIVAAGNPPTDEYYVTDINETALMARFAHVKLEPTFQEWVTYAKDAAFEPTLISFLQEQPELIADAKSSFTLPVKVDNRSWERINRLFKVGTPAALLEQLLLGIIGAERLVAYKLHLQNQERPLTGVEVLTGAKLDLVRLWSNPVDIKSSMLSITCDNVYKELEGLKNDEFTVEQAANFYAFIETMPKEVAYTLIHKLWKENFKIFNNFVRNPLYATKLVALAREFKGVK